MLKIVHHSADLLSFTPNPLEAIATAASVCRASDIQRPDEFVLRLIRMGHETPLEFVSFLFSVTTSRDVSHQLVRHRLASYQQESQRHVSYEKALPVVQAVNFPINTKAVPVWWETVENSYAAYKHLLSLGTRKEDARTVLPGCVATRLMVQMNLREFRHFLKLRLALEAWSEMRTLARLMALQVFDVVNDAAILLHGVATFEEIRS